MALEHDELAEDLAQAIGLLPFLNVPLGSVYLAGWRKGPSKEGSCPMKLIIPGRLPGLNDMTDAARKNKYESAKMKKEYTELVAWCAKRAMLPHFERVDLIITWYEPNMKRDKDNIMAGQKFILDGLVMAGIIKNDGWKQIADVTHRFRVDRANPRVEVELIEIKAS